uniref:RRM domain-containing protein n=1 Tax=Caenorhabditis japonica TaxID=281687 RepID=A0A8R1HHP7_CAEJA
MEIHLVHDRETGNFKGFAYVTFENESQLEKAISELNGTGFADRVLKVNRAQQRDRGGGRGGRGNFGGDRGGRGGGGFRRGGGGGGRGGGGGGDRFQDGGNRGHGGGRRHRNESETGSQHEGGHFQPRHQRQSEEGEAPSASQRAERPRLNLKPRSTDASEIEARRKQEEEETKKRQQKLFG